MTADERLELIADLTAALKSSSHLSEEEQQWVRLAIKKEAQSIKLREAIIEKSLVGLVWMGILGILYILKEFLFAHGIK
tara:strand:+ start:515 stop:751 length:237 start_codon:yes stop_codon:yes gene_type:complete